MQEKFFWKKLNDLIDKLKEDEQMSEPQILSSMGTVIIKRCHFQGLTQEEFNGLAKLLIKNYAFLLRESENDLDK